jgi:hypothetical protein
MLLTFVAFSVLLPLPCEYHIDCSGWTGAAVARYSMRATAWDGSIVEVVSELQPGSDSEVVQYRIWSTLDEDGWRVTKVGKAILVVEGSPKSPVFLIETWGKVWKPDVRRALKSPEKK